MRVFEKLIIPQTQGLRLLLRGALFCSHLSVPIPEGERSRLGVYITGLKMGGLAERPKVGEKVSDDGLRLPACCCMEC